MIQIYNLLSRNKSNFILLALSGHNHHMEYSVSFPNKQKNYIAQEKGMTASCSPILTVAGLLFIATLRTQLALIRKKL